jgi:hypothetical protein
VTPHPRHLPRCPLAAPLLLTQAELLEMLDAAGPAAGEGLAMLRVQERDEGWQEQLAGLKVGCD